MIMAARNQPMIRSLFGNPGRLPRLERQETQLSKAAEAGWIGTLIALEAAATL
jgi:hypothetical protein